MNSREIFKSIGKWIKDNKAFVFVSLLFIVLFTGISIYFDNSDINSATYNRDSTIYLLSTFFGNLVNVYSALEVYWALKENRPAQAFGLFKQIKKGGFRTFSYFIVMILKIFLWSLLFIIPGIIKFFEYQRGLYVISSNEQMRVGEAFKLAKDDMTGRKGQLFGLSLRVWLPLFAGTILLIATSIAMYEVSGGDILAPTFNIFNTPIVAFAALGGLISHAMSITLKGIYNYELDKVVDNHPTIDYPGHYQDSERMVNQPDLEGDDVNVRELLED